MGKRLTASGSFTVATIEDGVSVQAQYAPNSNPTSSQIHIVWQSGDLYMRTRESDDATWSDWHRIVGENGDETDYKFGISQYKTTSSSSTPPSDIATTDWADAPMAVSSEKPFLWSRVQKKVWNATSQSYDIESTRYIRLTGEDGTSVIAQYAPNANPTGQQIHDTWQDGDLYMRTKSTGGSWSDWHKIVGENGDETDYKFNTSDLKTGVNDSTASSHLSGAWQDTPKVVTNTFPYLWTRIVKRVWDETQQKYIDSDPSFSRLTGEKGEKGEKDEQGIQGIQGKTGRFYYYAQEWTNSSSVSYAVTDAEAPYFLYNGNYWVFNPTNNGTYTMSEMGIPSSSNENWKLMVTDFKFIITEAIFGAYAHFGSFIINGDWLVSTNGKIGDTEYVAGSQYGGAPAYLCFDSRSPFGPRTIGVWSSGTSFYNTAYNQKCDGFYVGCSTLNLWVSATLTGGTMSLAVYSSDGVKVSGDFELTGAGDVNVVAVGLDRNKSYHLRAKMSSSSYRGTISRITEYPFVPNFAVDGLTGKTYQNDAYVRGEIHATSGEFDGAFMSVDRKVAICGTPITTSSYWRGLAVGITPDDYDPYSQWGSSSDLVTAGARFNSDSSQGYGRIVTTRNGSDNMVLITSAPEGSDGGGRVAIRGGDGSVTCEKMNVSGDASITGILSVSGSLKTGSGTVSLPSNPKTGTVVFVKGTTGDVTSVSGNGKKIMESNSNTESNTRTNLGKNSAIYVFDGTRWIEFFCG